MRRFHYAWLILASSFVVITVAVGSRTALGAFVRPWEADFATTRAPIAGIGLVSFIAYGTSQLLVGRLLSHWSPRWVLAGGALLTGLAYIGTFFAVQVTALHLLWGILGAMGVAASSSVTVTILITYWFHTRRGLVLGIMTTGFSIGQAMIVPLAILGISSLGWRWTVLSLGVLMSLVLAPWAALVIRSHPSDKGLLPYGGPGNSLSLQEDHPFSWRGVWAALRAFRFWGLAVPYFVCGITTTGLIDTHLIPYAEDHHLPEATTGSAVFLMALLNTVGTLGAGWLSDKASKKNLLALIYLVRALTIAFLITVRDPISLFIFSAAFGLADFSTVAPTTSLTADYFGGRSLGFFYGLVALSHQLGSALGAYAPGLLHDLTGNYNLSFLGAAVILVIASIMTYLLPETWRPAVKL